jgi:beta-mannosidase
MEKDRNAVILKPSIETIGLDGKWQVNRSDLDSIGEAGLSGILRRKSGWIPATVPGEIHLDLVRAGEMPEPMTGNNPPRCAWPENHAWWYRRRFRVSKSFLEHEKQQLVFQGLDHFGQIFLNGRLLGETRNSFVPHTFDIRGVVRPGINELVVRATTGSELAPPDPKCKKSKGIYGRRILPGREWLRKPQFNAGWDWVDKLLNVGLWRGVRLEGSSGVVFHDLRTEVFLRDGRADVKISGSIENLSRLSNRPVLLAFRLEGPDGSLTRETIRLDAQMGRSPFSCLLTVRKPKLWWPNDMGAQPLYNLTATCSAERRPADTRSFRIGLRTVELDRSAWKGGGTRFCIKVNGQDVFCKGGNWVPCDAILPRADDPAKIRRLISEARTANLNFLRVWGGGVYPPPAFFDACDEAGILVWQDFMFACGRYPDFDEPFRKAVRDEAEAVVRLLRHHACLALWCGNNEDIWAHSWEPDRTSRIFTEVLPEVCRLHDPSRPYWPSSPCGGEKPNSELHGDCHWWMTPGSIPDWLVRYDVFEACRSRFVSEAGTMGPCVVDSIKQYLETDRPNRRSSAWRRHQNSIEGGTVDRAITKHYADPTALDLDSYSLYGQMFQAWRYMNFYEALRWRKLDPKDDCQGVAIWMYNDCWGETGWTLIDSYLRRKASFYAVQRACAPVKAISRYLDRQSIMQLTDALNKKPVKAISGRRDRLLVTRVINDTLQPVAAILKHGWWRTDGGETLVNEAKVRLAPNSAQTVASDRIPRAVARDPSRWIHASLLEGPGIPYAPSLYVPLDQRNMKREKPQLVITRKGNIFTLLSPVYCHGVHVDDHGAGWLSDNFFDLLPGVPVSVSCADTVKITEEDFRTVP